MSTTKSNSGTGLSLSAVLFIIFLVLKLTGNIDWSWWWVTSPLWITFAIGLALVGFVFLLIIVALIFGVSVEDIKSKIKIKK
jgi:Na+/H+-dicarboxylate symporter